MRKMNKFIKLGDYSGMLASVICILHCVLTPLALLVPFLSQIPHTDGFHYWMIVIIAVPIFFSLIPGFALHKKAIVLLFGLSGFLCYLVSIFVVGPRYGEVAEFILASIAGINLIIAHAKNRGYCLSCEKNQLVNCDIKPV
jgi:uncharacterized membrane protein YfhO